MLGCHGDEMLCLFIFGFLEFFGFGAPRRKWTQGRALLRGADLIKTQPPALTKNLIWEVVGAGGVLGGRWNVGIRIKRPQGYLRNRFRNSIKGPKGYEKRPLLHRNEKLKT